MASSEVFLDTSGWIALLNASDALHALADSLWRELGRTRTVVVTTDWIVAETGNGLARARSRMGFAEAVRLLRTSPRANLVFITDDLLSRSIDLFAARPDKTWGLVDCSSFLIMEQRGIREVFGNDRHFEQAAFRCLLPCS
jgi:predicted nucleic acid-binding protein